MGDLAARLKRKGLALNTATPGDASAHQALSGAAASGRATKAARSTASAPARLGLSNDEKHKLFTPLLDQGAKAVREGQRLQSEAEDDRLDSIRTTLHAWVQDCLVKDDKRQRLLEKGLLKCRVQAKWSKGFDEKLKQLVGSFGARLAADEDKENAEKHPAWLPRKERWLVGFDAPALERFLAAHPSALDPPSSQVRGLAEDFAAPPKGASGDAAAAAMAEALQARFGPVRGATVERARRIALDARCGGKRRGGPGAQAASEDQKARIETQEDVAWAAATLAPFGQSGDAGEPVVRAPASAAAPILRGLETVAGMPDLVSLLRVTSIGKVVSGYRRHPSAEVAKAAKELVSSWRAACRER